MKSLSHRIRISQSMRHRKITLAGPAMNDFALTPDGLLHRADCPEARRQAYEGLPVLTMYGCTRKPDDSIPRHSCLDEKR